jgi:putative transposase
MRSSRFSDEQIIGMIKEQEAGMPTADVCRKHGISTASFYKYWRAPIGWSGMSVSASLASGPLGRCSLARVVDTPMSYAA